MGKTFAEALAELIAEHNNIIQPAPNHIKHELEKAAAAIPVEEETLGENSVATQPAPADSNVGEAVEDVDNTAARSLGDAQGATESEK